MQDYRNISILEIQDAINEQWHLESEVTVLKRAGPYYILKPSTLANRGDLLHAGPWNINGALFLLQPWVPDIPLHRLDFSTAEMWVQIAGAPLEYMTLAMAVRLGSLIGAITSADRGTVMQQNMEFMWVRVRIPIRKPLIPGAFLILENGEPTWVQFGYEKLFKVCFNCGCVGHLKHRCPYTFSQARNIVRNRIHEARFLPHRAFWLAEGCPLYTRAIIAFKNSNRNRTSRIEILWAKDEPRTVIETENGYGICTTYFVRNQITSSSEEEPTDPSMKSGENTISLNELDTPSGPRSPYAANDQDVDGAELGSSSPEAQHSGSKSYGLDESFERALKE